MKFAPNISAQMIWHTKTQISNEENQEMFEVNKFSTGICSFILLIFINIYIFVVKIHGDRNFLHWKKIKSTKFVYYFLFN